MNRPGRTARSTRGYGVRGTPPYRQAQVCLGLVTILLHLALTLPAPVRAQETPPPPMLPPPPLINAAGVIVIGPGPGPGPTAGRAGPDLSPLPEINDFIEEDPPGKVTRVPQSYKHEQTAALPYLGQMLADPDIHFVPDSPTTGLNPRAVWETMMVPPPPTPKEQQALHLRNLGIGIFIIGAVTFLIAVPTLAAATEGGPLRDFGYVALGLGLSACGTGGALWAVGDVRVHAARRRAAGISLQLDPALPLPLGLTY